MVFRGWNDIESSAVQASAADSSQIEKIRPATYPIFVFTLKEL